MVQFPHSFVQLDKYPGYYWNTQEKKLYTMKIDGVLKPMKLSPAYRGPSPTGWVDAEAGYRISTNGRKRRLTYAYLCSIKTPPEVQTVPVKS